MPPKSLIKSLKAYWRSVGNALDMIEEIMARMPEGENAPPREVILKLERAKATDMVKFERMAENYDQQSVSRRPTKRPSKGTVRPCKPQRLS